MRPASVHPLLRLGHMPRTVGFAFGAVLMLSTFVSDTPLSHWLTAAAVCLLWPQLAWQVGKRAKDTKRAGRWAIFGDAFLVGLAVVFMKFQPEPSIAYIGFMLADALFAGGLELFLASLAPMLVGSVLGLGLHGLELQPRSSLLTGVASLLALALSIWAIVLSAHRARGLQIAAKRELAVRNEELHAAHQALTESRDQMAELATKLAKYLSPQVFKSIFTGEKQVKIETYRKRLTIFFWLFSDIRG